MVGSTDLAIAASGEGKVRLKRKFDAKPGLATASRQSGVQLFRRRRRPLQRLTRELNDSARRHSHIMRGNAALFACIVLFAQSL